MGKKALFGALLVALVATLTACGSSPTPATPAPAAMAPTIPSPTQLVPQPTIIIAQPKSTETVTPVPTRTATRVPLPSPTPVPNLRGEAIEALQAYMYKNFGTPGYAASWYENITGYAIYAGTVQVKTNLYPDSDAIQPARAMVVAVTSFIRNKANAKYNLIRVGIDGSNGERIMSYPE